MHLQLQDRFWNIKFLSIYFILLSDALRPTLPMGSCRHCIYCVINELTLPQQILFVHVLEDMNKQLMTHQLMGECWQSLFNGARSLLLLVLVSHEADWGSVSGGSAWFWRTEKCPLRCTFSFSSERIISIWFIFACLQVASGHTSLWLVKWANTFKHLSMLNP